MNNIKTTSLITAIFLAVAIASSAVEAGVIPINGTIAGSESYPPFPDPSEGFYVNGSVTSTDTQLGPFTMFYAFIVDATTPDFAGQGGFRLIDTNGDSIYALSLGQGTAPDPNGDVHVVERATITGGTGRYAYARGSFIVDRTANVITGDTSGTVSGSIVVRDH
jgi:hypothetical protein